MSDQKPKDHIVKCEDYLSQGDIFRIDLVAPMADTEIHIFRTIDGGYADDIEPDGTNGKVFTYEELSDLIKNLPPDKQCSFPFQGTDNRKYEKVLVYAELIRYFIIISQTCDISGVDHPAKPICTIAPIVTLAQYCQKQVPISYKDPKNNQEINEIIDIPDYFSEKIDPSFKVKLYDDFAFPKYIRENFGSWQKKTKNESLSSKLLGGLKNSLTLIIDNKLAEMYYILPNEEYGIPESYTDFCQVYTISTNILVNLKDKRIATINSPYKEQLARKFADYYARIATPYPMRGEPI